MEENRIVLLPGQLIISQNKEIVWTLLGSCISIVFYNPGMKISAVCHAQLPKEGSEGQCTDNCPKPCGSTGKKQYKYVTCSFKYMVQKFKNLGIGLDEIEVGLYGGASIYSSKKVDIFKIGERNLKIARELIMKNKMKITKESCGGNMSRTIIHYADTGITKITLNESIVI